MFDSVAQHSNLGVEQQAQEFTSAAAPEKRTFMWLYSSDPSGAASRPLDVEMPSFFIR